MPATKTISTMSLDELLDDLILCSGIKIPEAIEHCRALRAEIHQRVKHSSKTFGLWDKRKGTWHLDCFDDPHVWSMRRDAESYRMLFVESERDFFEVKKYEENF